MPQQEQTEWPSFEAVLRDIAPSDVAKRTQAAIAASRRALDWEDLEVTPPEGELHGDSIPVHPDSTAIAAPEALLPPPLSPLELDTSTVRDLLEPRASQTEDLFELTALEPIEELPVQELPIEELPVAEVAVVEAEPIEAAPEHSPTDSVAFWDPIDLEDVASAEPIELENVASVEPVEAEIFEPTVEMVEAVTFEVDEPVTATDEAGLFDDINFDSDSDEVIADLPDEAFSVLPIDSLYSTETAPAVDDPFDFTDPLDFGDPFEAVDETVFDTSRQIEEIPAGAVFELDSHLFDADGEATLQDHAEAPSLEAETFDSIATANAIEGDLGEISDLFQLDSEFELDPIDDIIPTDTDLIALDNVIPLHPEPTQAWDLSQDFNAEMAEPDLPAPQAPSSWTRLDPAEAPIAEVDETLPEPDPVDLDPWADMRPTDDITSGGFWTRRPKFFGGEERKKKKAERLASRAAEEPSDIPSVTDKASATPPATDELPGPVYESACPNCGGDSQIDLDDPVGRRVHASCPACDHMWFTPYLESQVG